MLDASGWSCSNTVKTAVSSLRWKKRNAPLPYRTNAYFGFRSPNNGLALTHFHIPILPSSYLRRSSSILLDNIFGTERYLYMTNDSLKRTLKRKLNFEHGHRPVRQRHYCDSEIDPFYFMDIDTIGKNNLERISEVCDARLCAVQFRRLQEGNRFLEKLGDIQYSRPWTPEKATISTGNHDYFVGL